MGITPQKQASEEPLKIQLGLIITVKKDAPALEIRKMTLDPALIKRILDCAFRGDAIIAYPRFQDVIKGMAALQSKGIIHYDKEKNEVEYLI